MTQAIAPRAPVEKRAALPAGGARHWFLREFLRQSVLARIGFALAMLLLLSALLAPWIAPANPAAQSLPERLQPPSTSCLECSTARASPFMCPFALSADAVSQASRSA